MFLIDTIDHFISGDWGEETLTAESPKATYCVRGADINNVNAHSFYGTPLRYVARSSFDNKQLQAGDIVIEKSGGSPTQSTGRTAFISQQCIDELQDVVCSNFCAAFRVKENWNSKYVFYYMQHVYNSGVFFNFEGKTSGLRNLQIENAFKSIPIEHIDKPVQDRIVHMLDKIESLIVLKNAINRNLEQVARQLYDYWFVQFDFPNHEGRPYKSSGGDMVWDEKLNREIPFNWQANSITAIADIMSGGTPSKSVDDYWNGSIPFFGPTDVGNSIFQIETKEHITTSGLDHCASSLYDKGTIIITARGSIGKLVIIGKPMAMNQSCYALRPKNNETEYLYFLTIELIDQLKQKGSGSVFKSIIAIDIETSWLSIAPDNMIKDYCKICSPIFDMIKEHTIEIERLRRLRDEIMPMLLNGQVNCDLSL